MFLLIAAVDEKNGIGLNGSIPWRMPEDMKFFVSETNGHYVIMGRKTYESIKRPLPNRTNIVISGNKEFRDSLPADVISFATPEECVMWCLGVCDTPDQLILPTGEYPSSSINHKTNKYYVIGGKQIYEWFVTNNYIHTYLISKIPGDFKCDTGFDEYPLRGLHIGYQFKDFAVYTDKINHEEQSLLDLIREIETKGVSKRDRTGVGTKSLFGRQLRFSLENNQFPLMTTRPMFLRGVFEELMLYLRGQTDSKILESVGINVWKPNTTREFLDSKGLRHLPVGDMGPSYGFLFRHFGATYTDCTADYTGQGVDQLSKLVNTLKTNPGDRRMIISLWDPNVVDKCPLPPCLYNYQFYVSDNKLSCMMTQRSSDIVVAGGWNVATGALLTIMLAKVTDLLPGELIWNLGDAHIYNNLHEQTLEQIERKPYLYPKLRIAKKENITDYEFTDLKLESYCAQKQIKVVMNA